MTNRQKETVLVLARLYANGHIGDGEYITLMEYVMGNLPILDIHPSFQDKEEGGRVFTLECSIEEKVLDKLDKIYDLLLNKSWTQPYTPPSIGVPYEPVTPLYGGTSKVSYSTNTKEE